MQPNFAAMSQPQGGADPLAPKPKRNALPGILGILGDALAAYGGQRGVFAPMMMQQQQDDRQDNRFQQQLAARIEMERQQALAKAQEPPSWLRDATIFNQLPPEQRNQVLGYRDAMFPVIADIAQPDGSVMRTKIPRGGAPEAGAVEDGYIFLGGDPGDPSNWRRQ
jgi:hypothetical protein